MPRCNRCGKGIKWLKRSDGTWTPLNFNGTSHFETCPGRKHKEKEKYKDTSHDYTVSKIKDRKQTNLNQFKRF